MKNNSTTKIGIVSFKSTSHCGVMIDRNEVLCQIAKNLIIEGEGKPSSKRKSINARALENQIVVGDHVNVLLDSSGAAIITERLSRKNQISRRSSMTRIGGQLIEQVLASNVDQVVVVFAAANPEPKWNLLDRYLVMAEAVELPVWIIITKMDLVDDQSMEEMNQQLSVYQKIGYRILLTSSIQHHGIDQFYDLLKGKTSVMIGKSGVGKTSLVNSIIPERNERVSAVNEVTGKGRHTTSAMRLISINEQTLLIDSPGTREFGLWDVDPDDLEWYFAEMRPYLGKCKFKLDCQHDEEPGCAIRQAVVNQQIDPRRYQSFLRLKEDFLS